jgi:hypothetical protein
MKNIMNAREHAKECPDWDCLQKEEDEHERAYDNENARNPPWYDEGDMVPGSWEDLFGPPW